MLSATARLAFMHVVLVCKGILQYRCDLYTLDLECDNGQKEMDLEPLGHMTKAVYRSVVRICFLSADRSQINFPLDQNIIIKEIPIN